MRVCARCKESKPVEAFSRKGEAGWQPYCKPCHSRYRKEHYEANKEKYIAKASKWSSACRKRNVELLVTYLQNHPCVDCGETDPVVLQFDHVRGEKSYNLGRLWADRQWESHLEEIAKCEIRCANCHTRKTAKQFGWLKSLVGEV